MKKKLLLFLVLFGLVFTGCKSDKKSSENGEDNKKAENKETVTDYAEMDNSALEIAAYDGDGQAAYELARRYDYGKGVDQNFSNAFTWYKRSEELGYDKSLMGLGYMYMYGLGTDTDYKLSESFFNKAIAAGLTEGCVGLGRLYLAQTDKTDAALNSYYYFRKASDAKIPMGTYYLGYMYEKGIGVAANIQMAIDEYKSLSDTDFSKIDEYDLYPYAMSAVRLGIIYANDTGQFSDKEEALSLFEKAAKAGSKEGSYYAGVAYQNGLGTTSDYDRAMEYFVQSSEKKYAPAMNQIAYMYFNGQGVEADTTQAIYYLKRAAIQGYAPSQINLGYIYENGYGEAVNLQMAKSYYEMAAASGYVGADEAVTGVEQLIDDQNKH